MRTLVPYPIPQVARQDLINAGKVATALIKPVASQKYKEAHGIVEEIESAIRKQYGKEYPK